MKLSLKQKIALMLAGLLAGVTVLDTMLASYFTYRQNQESASAMLKRDLLAWHDELQDMTVHMRSVALSAIGETLALDQLAELNALEFKLADALHNGKDVKEAARTLAFSKSVSLNRLHLVLRSGGFSAINVYINGQLSHQVSASEVGMFVQRGNNERVWVKAAADNNGNLPTRNWLAWQEGSAPATVSLPPIDRPQVAFAYPSADSMLIEVAVPVEGSIEPSLLKSAANPAELSVFDARIAGPVNDPVIPVTNRPPVPFTTFAVVVFQKRIDPSFLQAVARKTGMWPLLFSPDGRYRQQWGPLNLNLQQLLLSVAEATAKIRPQMISSEQGAFYAAALPWQFERQQGFVLALVSAKDEALHNFGYTVAAIITVAGLILAFSIGVGIFWIGRFINPIISLSNAVKAIGLANELERSKQFDYDLTAEDLRALAISAPGEISDLAWAFHMMIAEQHYSFEALEQRVQERTAELRATHHVLEEQNIEPGANNSLLQKESNEHKKAEERLALLNYALDQVKEAVYLIGEDGRIHYVNQEASRALGYSYDELIGMSIPDIDSDCPPEDWPMYWNALKAKGTAKLDRYHRTKDGRVFPVEINANYFEFDGQDYTLTLSHNITERKQMVEALNKSRQILTEAQRIAQLGSWELDLETNRLSWSDEIFRIFEIDPQQFGASYESFVAMVHPNDREAVDLAYSESLQNRESYEFEHRLLMPDGRVKYVLERCETDYDDEGTPLRSLGTVQDISERKLMETELKSQADFQQTILNAVADAGMQVMMIEEGRIIHVGNRKLAHEFGFTDEDIDTHPALAAIIHPDDQDQVMDYYRRRMAGKAVPASYELGLVTKNGERREYETSVAIVPGSSPIRMITVGKDITERKRMEHALASREQELRALTESSPGMVGSFYLRPDGGVCMPYTSPNIQELFGLRPEDVADDASPLLALNHPADAERVTASIAESARTMTTWHTEFRILHPTRGERWMEGHSNPFPHPDGGIIWYGYVHDITERKQAEAEKQHLINILEQSADFIGSADMQGKLLYCNSAARRMVGLAEDTDLSCLHIPDFHPAWALKIVEEQGIPAALKDGVWRGETALLHLDGQEIPVSQLVVLHRDADGNPLFLSTIMRDITERKQAENEIRALNASLEQRVLERTEELNRQTQYLRTMIDTLPMMAWFKDSDSRFLVVNQTFATAYAHNVNDLIGKTDLDACPREHAEAYLADDAEVMATGQRKTIEEPFVDAHEGEIWVETIKAPVADEDGRILGTVGVARDISERKVVERAREEALAEAERLAQLRSEFMARMSHELRTPLNGILGYAQILLGENRLDQRYNVMVDVIHQCGEHLLNLINDILDFAKIEAGKQELSLRAVYLPEFLSNIAGIINVRVEQKGLAFVCDIAADVPAGIHADETRLRQVLLNLLSNAVKYTGRGRICLLVTVLESGRLRFKVQDSGIGIDDEQLETIFRPFEQAGGSQNRSGGTGLGLPISRELVRLMGSDIHVVSRVGVGSTFWFDLDVPVVDVCAEIMPAGQRFTGYSGSRRRLLVVDDIDINRSLLLDMLNHLGFETAEASSGMECLKSTGIQLPDLVLLDMVMPGMDGLETASRLRRLPGFGQTPIIAVSASTSDDDISDAMKAGVNAFISKPVELKKLASQIGNLLKLDWVYALPEAEPSPQQKLDEWLETPSMKEMEILHQMALEGSMRDITSQAEYLEKLDDRYRPFAGQLRKLSQAYQSKAILDLVERYINRIGTLS